MEAQTMRAFLRPIWTILRAGFLGILILVLGAGIWSALVVANLNTSPAIPWSVLVMALVLVLMWRCLSGKGWPRGNSATRHDLLRANPVSATVFGWSVLAGCLSVVALAGFWIVMVQLVKMPGNALPDFSRYPLITVASMVIMGSIAAPLTEEPAFRGYCQVILEREFSGPIAVVLSSALFALGHGPTQGFLLPKLLFYFLVGIVFGSTAFLTKSILPAIPAHVFGLLIFFTLIWPQDASRRVIWEAGPDLWLWLHAAQVIVFALLAFWAFRRLAKRCKAVAIAKPQAA
jgi:membrane protease YdiL (CAAX protease family)